MSDKDFNDKVDHLEKRIDDAKKDSMDHVPEQTASEKSRSIGMSAGSNFISSVIAGALVGYGFGWLVGNIPLFLITFMFAGFGWGIYRAAKIMQ
jgi:F0F1-type ATP synthase assembly protein I